jgi:hypothetical protein
VQGTVETDNRTQKGSHAGKQGLSQRDTLDDPMAYRQPAARQTSLMHHLRQPADARRHNLEGDHLYLPGVARRRLNVLVPAKALLDTLR